MEILLFWLIGSIAVGIWNNSRGHSFFAGFVFSLILSPLLAAIIVAVRSPNVAKVEGAALATGEMRKCPMCAELVKREAIKCKHCGADLPALEPEPKPEIWG